MTQAAGVKQVPQVAVPARRKRLLPGDLGIALLFLAPALLGFLVFHLLPTIRGFYLSLTDWTLLGEPHFIGLENFQEVVGDELFWNALVVTLEYVVINIGLQTVLAVGLAVLMDRLTKSVFIRATILLPYLIPNVVAALVFLWMLDFSLGIGNVFLDAIGLPRIAFFGEEAWAIPTIALINVWRHMGYTALLIFAGLQTIPKDVYEAASIDGASEWQSFWRMTIPLLRPVLALVLVITVIGSFQIFDTVAVTTRGGPVNATRVIYYYIFEKAFTQFDFGYAAALSVVLFIILVGVTLFQLRFLRAGESALA